MTSQLAGNKVGKGRKWRGAQVRSRAVQPDHPGVFRAAFLAVMGFALMLLWSLPLRAEDGAVVKSHGFAEFGDLRYPAGFAHFDYVNPEAPKGGELSISAVGTFDSMNPFTRKGRAGALASEQVEILMVAS